MNVRFLALLGALLAAACGKPTSNDGAVIYDEICARCHGERGVPEPEKAVRLELRDLTDPAVQSAFTDEALRVLIEKGSQNERMPGYQSDLTEQQIAAVIKYVRALARPR